MSKLILSDVAAGYNLQKINDNFDKIADTINNDVLFRRNPTGEPNSMVGSDLDMDSNRILNLPAPLSPNEPARLQDLEDVAVGKFLAENITFSPTANIHSTDVQHALEEVDTNWRTGVDGVKAYADSGDASTLAAAKQYADTGDANTLASAKAYTDTAVLNTVPADGSVTAAKIVSSQTGIDSINLKLGVRKVVTSIDALRNVDKTKYTQVFVTGYYASGDGGGGDYYLDAADTTTADNKGTVIVATDGGRWKLIHKGVISVKQFGAKGDGSTDDTVAIKGAIAAVPTGGVVFFPDPSEWYNISDTLTLSGTHITLQGSNGVIGGAMIRMTANGLTVLNVSGNFNRVTGLAFTYAVAQTSGTCIYVTGASFQMDNFDVSGCFIGVEVTGGASAVFMTQFSIRDYSSYGLYVHDTNDVYISQFVFNTNTSTGHGIRLFNRIESFNATDGDVLGGLFSMTCDATTNASGSRPAYSSFQGVYFDLSAQGVFIANSVLIDFTNCWWSGGRSGSGFAGCVLNSTDSISFTNCKFFNNGGHGCQVNNTCKRTTFDSCKFESNSVTAGSGVAHGLVFGAGATDFVVKGCIAHNGLYNGQQGYGILINSGASDRYVVADNLIAGNTIAGVSDGGTGTNKRVANNY